MTPSLLDLKIRDGARHAIDILPEGGIVAVLPQFMLPKGHKTAARAGISLSFIKKSLILRGLTTRLRLRPPVQKAHMQGNAR